MSFYDSYVRLCNSAGKSPSSVALDIGIEKSTVTRWRKGSTPNYATKLKVADYFGCTVEDLTRSDIKLDLQFFAEEKPAPGGNELSKKEQLLNLIDSMDKAELIEALKAVTAKLEEV